GLAHTLVARSCDQGTSPEFARIQFTPDLMPSDVTGSSIYNQRDADFQFRPGPIFANLLLADEINRAPPKTQAALLEAMQERQVTTEGESRRLGPPFLVMATQNPIEYEGTYPLPDAQRAFDPGRRVAARIARADEALALSRRTRWPRLRDARRRQDHRSPRTRPSPDLAPGAVGAADLGRGRGARASRDRPDAGRRG